MRWIVTITYRTDAGPLPVEHDIEELHDIHDIVERGPDWNTITSIKIRLRAPIYRDTVEQSENR